MAYPLYATINCSEANIGSFTIIKDGSFTITYIQYAWYNSATPLEVRMLSLIRYEKLLIDTQQST